MNKNKGEHSFVVGSETFNARLTVNSLCTLESVTGEEASVTMASFANSISNEKMNVTALRAILWASLLHNHEGKTLQGVGEIIEQMGIPKASAAVIAIMKAAFPDAEGKDAEGSPQ